MTPAMLGRSILSGKDNPPLVNELARAVGDIVAGTNAAAAAAAAVDSSSSPACVCDALENNSSRAKAMGEYAGVFISIADRGIADEYTVNMIDAISTTTRSVIGNVYTPDVFSQVAAIALIYPLAVSNAMDAYFVAQRMILAAWRECASGADFPAVARALTHLWPGVREANAHIARPLGLGSVREWSTNDIASELPVADTVSAGSSALQAIVLRDSDPWQPPARDIEIRISPDGHVRGDLNVPNIQRVLLCGVMSTDTREVAGMCAAHLLNRSNSTAIVIDAAESIPAATNVMKWCGFTAFGSDGEKDVEGSSSRAKSISFRFVRAGSRTDEPKPLVTKAEANRVMDESVGVYQRLHLREVYGLEVDLDIAGAPSKARLPQFAATPHLPANNKLEFILNQAIDVGRRNINALTPADANDLLICMRNMKALRTAPGRSMRVGDMSTIISMFMEWTKYHAARSVSAVVRLDGVPTDPSSDLVKINSVTSSPRTAFSSQVIAVAGLPLETAQQLFAHHRSTEASAIADASASATEPSGAFYFVLPVDISALMVIDTTTLLGQEIPLDKHRDLGEIAKEFGISQPGTGGAGPFIFAEVDRRVMDLFSEPDRIKRMALQSRISNPSQQPSRASGALTSSPVPAARSRTADRPLKSSIKSTSRKGGSKRTVFPDGHVEWEDSEGFLHRGDDLPALEATDGEKQWWFHGKRHRENDKPAKEYPDGGKEWYYDDERHRGNDKPALEYPDGRKEWYRHGKPHRGRGQPAYVHVDRKEWIVDGKKHRDGDLPAVEIFEKPGWFGGWLGAPKIKRREWWQDGKLHRSKGRPAIMDEEKGNLWYEFGEKKNPPLPGKRMPRSKPASKARPVPKATRPAKKKGPRRSKSGR